MPEPALLTLPEAAERIRTSERHLRRLISGGAGPAVTALGHKRFVRDDHLRVWLDACAATKPQEAAA